MGLKNKAQAYALSGLMGFGPSLFHSASHYAFDLAPLEQSSSKLLVWISENSKD